MARNWLLVTITGFLVGGLVILTLWLIFTRLLASAGRGRTRSRSRSRSRIGSRIKKNRFPGWLSFKKEQDYELVERRDV